MNKEILKSIEEKKKAWNNPKRFYAYISNARKTRAKIGPLKNEDGEIVADAKEQAEILNKYLASVFTRSNKVTPTVRSSDRNTSM